MSFSTTSCPPLKCERRRVAGPDRSAHATTPDQPSACKRRHAGTASPNVTHFARPHHFHNKSHRPWPNFPPQPTLAVNSLAPAAAPPAAQADSRRNPTAHRPPPTAHPSLPPRPRRLAWLCCTPTPGHPSPTQTGVAPLYILFNALIAALLVWAPYTLLVEFSMLLSVPSIFLFMWSFVALRVQQPTVQRPFRIPGGIATAVLITVVPIAISISYAAIIGTEALIGRPGRADVPALEDNQASDEDGLEERQPAYQIYSMLGVVSFGLLVHAVGSRCTSSRAPRLKPR